MALSASGNKALLMTPDATIREPDQIRQTAARKLRAVLVSGQFQAILACLLDENWTTPRLVEMLITPDSHLLGRCEDEPSFQSFLEASEDLWRNIPAVARAAELDGDEIGYLVGGTQVVGVTRLAAGNNPGPISLRLKRGKRADETYPLKLTQQQRESLVHCTNLRRSLQTEDRTSR